MNIKELFDYYYNNKIKCPYCNNNLFRDKYSKFKYFSCYCLDGLNINGTGRCPFFIGEATLKSFALIIYYNDTFYRFEEFEDNFIEIRIAKNNAKYKIIFLSYLNINFENKFPHFNLEKINTLLLFQ